MMHQHIIVRVPYCDDKIRGVADGCVDQPRTGGSGGVTGCTSSVNHDCKGEWMGGRMVG